MKRNFKGKKITEIKTPGECAGPCGEDPRNILFAACEGYPPLHKSLLAPMFAKACPDLCVIHIFAKVMAWRLHKLEAMMYGGFPSHGPLTEQDDDE